MIVENCAATPEVLFLIGVVHGLAVFAGAATTSLVAVGTQAALRSAQLTGWLTFFLVSVGGFLFSVGFIFPTGRGHTPRWEAFVRLVVIVAPLTEELLFRGLILRGLLRHYTTRTAIIASAVLFGVFHLNPWQFLGATVLGVLFAWIFVRTGSLYPCIFGHAFANGVPLIASVLKVDIVGFTSELTGVEFQPLWFDALGLVLSAVGLWRLRRYFVSSLTRFGGQ